LVLQEFLGPEGHVSNGVSTTSFLPSPGETALQLTLQLLQGGGIGVAQDNNHLAYLANLNFFYPIADEHSLNMSLTGLYGVHDEEAEVTSRTVSLDLLYRWKKDQYSSFLLGAQLLYADHEVDEVVHTKPFGYTIFAQYQISSRLYAGLRWDETDFLADDSLQKSQISPYLTWYTSEFFRARLAYEHTWSDDEVTDGLDSVLLEITVVFGAHPPEPFWVNK
jgi:hypothetical protein